MPLTDTKLKALKPRDKSYQEADEGGLFVEVLPSGQKTWRLRYRIGGRGAKQEKVTLGEYPVYSLGDARAWREASKALAEKQGARVCRWIFQSQPSAEKTPRPVTRYSRRSPI